MPDAEPDQGFTFVDRRRRGADAPPAETVSSRVERPEVPPATTPRAVSPGPDGRPPADLRLLCEMLASDAMAHLGQVPDPETGPGVVDLGRARLAIDLLAVLADKTRGNRTPEETALLEDLLAGLRMAFVRLSRGG